RRSATAICTLSLHDALPIFGMRNASDDTIALPTLNIVAKDFGYEVPAEVPSGPTRLTLTNAGRELHHAQLVKLEEGKTLADVARSEEHTSELQSRENLVCRL